MARASSAVVDTRARASISNGTRTTRQQVEVGIVGRAGRRARRQLHAAAAGRDEADADLDEARCRARSRRGPPGAEHDLGAAAERQAERRATIGTRA